MHLVFYVIGTNLTKTSVSVIIVQKRYSTVLHQLVYFLKYSFKKLVAITNFKEILCAIYIDIKNLSKIETKISF